MTASKPAAYQQAVYEELRELARDYFDFHWHDLPVRPRTAVLLAAASGAGKTFLARHLAAELRLPLLDLQYANWVVTGATSRGAARTLALLYRFVQENEKGVILFDEIDKLGVDDGGSDWTRAVHIEAFSVLDKRIVDGVIEAIAQDPDQSTLILTRKELQQKFVRGFFLIGCGAWQELWSDKATAGFTAASSPVRSRPSSKHLLSTLRPEILNRFRSDILIIPPLTRTEYWQLLNETLARLPRQFQEPMEQTARDTIEHAIEMRKGFRWVEEVLTGAIRMLRRSQTQKRDQQREYWGLGDTSASQQRVTDLQSGSVSCF
jgi:SpoVK/Ycf46/Vps4 family AAA+-type ATPase